MSEEEKKPDHRIPAATCPTCTAPMTGAGSMDGSPSPAPRPGDTMICIKCASVNVVTKEWKLRSITREELRAIPLQEACEIRLFQMRIFQLNRNRAKKASRN